MSPAPTRRSHLILGGVAVGALALGAGTAWWRLKLQPAEDEALQTLLAQSFPNAQGQATSLAQYRQRPLVLNFWATWCAPCVEEMPELSVIADQIREKKVEVLGIGVDSLANISKFTERVKVSYPLLCTGAAGIELVRRFGNPAGGLPFTVLVDRNGQIQGRILGRFRSDELLERSKALAS
jgi:peroxiredoxin